MQIYKGENTVYTFTENVLEEVEYSKKIRKKHIKKEFVTSRDNKRWLRKANK